MYGIPENRGNAWGRSHHRQGHLGTKERGAGREAHAKIRPGGRPQSCPALYRRTVGTVPSPGPSMSFLPYIIALTAHKAVQKHTDNGVILS